MVCTRHVGVGEIVQWLVSPSVKPAVQVRVCHDPFVSERWNSINMLLTHPASAADWFNKSVPCVIMSTW